MKNWIAALRRRFSAAQLSTDAATLDLHSGDAWFAAARPEAVFFPRKSGEISQLLKIASKFRVPVTARGAGRGYVGGCVPDRGGIVVSLARMNRILEINPADGVAVVQPGVITGVLQEAARKKGLFYPPDPASLGECFLGGNVATNAGGPRAVKYGVTRQYVLGLEVILADGTLVKLGGRTHKNKTGFDLLSLFVGSEGLLGITSEITLRLLPHPPARALLSAGFRNIAAAAAAVNQILQRGFLPSALEIADAFTLEAARRHLGKQMVPRGRAHLLVEIDGQPASVRGELRQLERLIRSAGALEVAKASREIDCERLWGLRRGFSMSLRATGLTKLNEDVVVPRGRLVDLVRFAEKLKKKHGVEIATFGHAGDGNLHVNLMIDLNRKGMKRTADRVLDELFSQVLRWGGAITGEHGIGLAKLPWWREATSPALREVHRRIKKALDPKGILNPGKFV